MVDTLLLVWLQASRNIRSICRQNTELAPMTTALRSTADLSLRNIAVIRSETSGGKTRARRVSLQKIAGRPNQPPGQNVMSRRSAVHERKPLAPAPGG